LAVPLLPKGRFLAGEKINEDRSIGISVLTGVLAVIAYSKWCNISAKNQERIIDEEVNRLNNGTRDQSQFNQDFPQEPDSISQSLLR